MAQLLHLGFIFRTQANAIYALPGKVKRHREQSVEGSIPRRGGIKQIFENSLAQEQPPLTSLKRPKEGSGQVGRTPRPPPTFERPHSARAPKPAQGCGTGIRSVHLEVQTSQDGGQQLAKASVPSVRRDSRDSGSGFAEVQESNHLSTGWVEKWKGQATCNAERSQISASGEPRKKSYKGPMTRLWFGFHVEELMKMTTVILLKRYHISSIGRWSPLPSGFKSPNHQPKPPTQTTDPNHQSRDT